jgi:hypothetical protein
MGWLVALVLTPILFALVTTYAVVKLTLVGVRAVFAPLRLRR